MMNKKRWGLVFIGVVIILIGTFTAIQRVNLSTVNYGSTINEILGQEDALNEVVDVTGDGMNKIAIIEVDGTIMDQQSTSLFSGAEGYNHQKTMNTLSTLKNDSNLKGLLLVVNSPGGGVYESVELYHALEELKQERNIPIYVSMKQLAASGGYMISMVGDKIYAANETTTGSIGVIRQGWNVSKFLEDKGIATEVYKSGNNKNMGSPFKAPTDEEKEIFQKLIDESYNEFVKIVADGRHKSVEEIKPLADGRIYSGTQAKENGLIDEIGYEDAALKALQEKTQLSNPQIVEYTNSVSKFTLNGLFNQLSKLNFFSQTGELQDLTNFMEANNKDGLYYLYDGGK